MLRFVLLFAFASFSGAVSAQNYPAFDPSAAPYAPRLVALQGCGFSIGLDSSWNHHVSRPRSGLTRHEINNYDLPRANQTLELILVRPVLAGTIDCEAATPSSDAGRTAYNQTMVESMRAGVQSNNAQRRVSSIQRGGIPLLSNAFWFSYEQDRNSRGEPGPTFVLSANGHAGDTRVWMYFSHSHAVAPSNAQRVPAGTNILMDLGRGQVAIGQLTQPAMQVSTGTLYPIRTMDMERAFIHTLVGTIR